MSASAARYCCIDHAVSSADCSEASAGSTRMDITTGATSATGTVSISPTGAGSSAPNGSAASPHISPLPSLSHLYPYCLQDRG